MKAKNTSEVNFSLGEIVRSKLMKETKNKQSKGIESIVMKQEKRQDNRKFDNRMGMRALNGKPVYEDGCDHINISNSGKTELGRMLSMEAYYNFTLPEYGTFNSIYALWVWLRTKGHPEFLRTAEPQELRSFMRNRTSAGMDFNHPHARFLCAYVMLDRIQNDELLATALKRWSKIPLAGYYHSNDVAYKHSYSDWWVDAIDLLRYQVATGKELDLDELYPGIDAEDALIPLKTGPVVGQVSDIKLPKKKQPKVKEKVSSKVKEEDSKGGKPLASYLSEGELAEPAKQNTRLFGFKTKEARAEMMIRLLQATEGAYKEVIESTIPGVVISMSNDDTHVLPDDVTCHAIATFDPETFKFISVATSHFQDPFVKVTDPQLDTLNEDSPQTLIEQIKDIMKIDKDVELKPRTITHKETTEEAPVVEAEKPSEDVNQVTE